MEFQQSLTSLRAVAIIGWKFKLHCFSTVLCKYRWVAVRDQRLKEKGKKNDR
jgi:hypothetical protein